ncbi:hypothetical protein BH11MYX1_BH11MYX1_55990 [soil metagenome]
MLLPAPPNLVDERRQHLGRFSGPPARVNLIDAAYHHLPRPLRKLRLKEWQAVQLGGPGVFVCLALFDAKLMSLMQAKIYDRERGHKSIHEWKLRPGALTIADQLIDSTTRYADKRGSLEFRNEVGAGRITVALDLHGIGELPRVAGKVVIHTDRGASHVASLPFAGEVGMYSHKGMFPAAGELAVGARTFTLEATDSLALLDDHKGFYPYVMRWDWVTSAAYVGDEACGFNLTRNQCRDPETFNENCAWRGDRLGVLPAVTFAREHVRTANERWRIRDREGRVDVTFHPTVPGDVSVNAVIVHSRYRGPFGQFEGRLEPEGLAPIRIDGWFGMGEDFHLRC